MDAQLVWNLWKLVILAMSVIAAYLLVSELYPDVEARLVRDRLVETIDRKKIKSPVLRLLFPIWNIYAGSMRRYKLVEYRQGVQKKLVQAGVTDQMTVDHFLAAKVFFTVAIPLLLALAVDTFKRPLGVVLAAVMGFYFADLWLGSMIKDRQTKILRAMPLSVDLLTLTVEAGLDFTGGIQRVVDKGPSGPLQEELRTLLQDIRLGTTRANGLRALEQRCAMVEVTSFTSVLIQADQLGASIGPVLRAQAERMRAERFSRAEKMGAEAASKIIFPMIIFIMPAVFLILIGPLILKMIYGPK
ncbi:MAG: type II secretion system F family protein [Acidobacteriia bacterium]|nr:type II secretion system F family protein [Terriglobia bacterium]